MMNDDDVVVARASGREAVEELRSSGALDALFERLDGACSIVCVSVILFERIDA